MNAQTCPQCDRQIGEDWPHSVCPRCLLGAAIPEAASERVYTTSPQAGHRAGQLQIEQVQAAFPDLEILEFIGRGGMGEVYRARQIHLDRIVALKVLPPKLDPDPTFAERFAQEARTLAKLNHPNIVTLFEFGERQGLFFLLMEYVDGTDLRRLMMDATLSAHDTLGIVGQVCSSLQYAHDLGIVHRDVKPENILVDDRGQVKIADFGLAKLLSAVAPPMSLTQTQQVLGTPHYMAPEQMEKPSSVDHRADIYSLGVVFYELLTGELPLGRFAEPSRRSGSTPQLDPIVLRTLEKNPDDRFQQARQLQAEVTNVDIDTPPPAAEPANRHSDEPTQQGAKPPMAGHENSGVRPPSVSGEFVQQNYEGVVTHSAMMRVIDQGLEIEHNSKWLFAMKSSPTETAVIPWDTIEALSTKRGVARDRIELEVNSLTALSGIGAANNNRVVLTTQRRDWDRVQKLVNEGRDRCGFAPETPWSESYNRAYRTPAVLLMLLAAIDLAVSAALGVQLMVASETASPMIAVSFLKLIPNGILLASAMSLYGGSRVGGMVAGIQAVIPLFVLWPFTLAVGIWTIARVSRDPRTLGEPSEPSTPAPRSTAPPKPPKFESEAWATVPDPPRIDWLTPPTRGLRVAGLFSVSLAVCGLVAIFTSFAWFDETPTVIASAAWFLAIGGQLAYGVLLTALPHCSRFWLKFCCFVGLAPVSAMWFLSAPFSVWTLSRMANENSTVPQRRGFPYAVFLIPLALMLGLFVAVFVSFVPHSDTSSRASSSMSFYWPDGSKSQMERQQCSNMIRTRVQMTTSGLITVGVRPNDLYFTTHDSPDIRATIRRLASTRGAIQLARVLTEAEAKELVPFELAGSMNQFKTQSGEVVATEFPLTELAQQVDASYGAEMADSGGLYVMQQDSLSVNPNSGITVHYDENTQTLHLTLPDEDSDRIRVWWNEREQKMPMAIVVDGEICGITSVDSESNPGNFAIYGAYPLRRAAEWQAVIRTGVLPFALDTDDQSW